MVHNCTTDSNFFKERNAAGHKRTKSARRDVPANSTCGCGCLREEGAGVPAGRCSPQLCSFVCLKKASEVDVATC